MVGRLPLVQPNRLSTRLRRTGCNPGTLTFILSMVFIFLWIPTHCVFWSPRARSRQMSFNDVRSTTTAAACHRLARLRYFSTSHNTSTPTMHAPGRVSINDRGASGVQRQGAACLASRWGWYYDGSPLALRVVHGLYSWYTAVYHSRGVGVYVSKHSGLYNYVQRGILYPLPLSEASRVIPLHTKHLREKYQTYCKK